MNNLPEVNHETIQAMIESKNPIEIAIEKVDILYSEIGTLKLKMQFLQNDLSRLRIQLDKQNPSRP